MTLAFLAALSCSLAIFFSVLGAPFSASARSRLPMSALSPLVRVRVRVSPNPNPNPHPNPNPNPNPDPNPNLGFLEHVKKAWPKLPVEAAAGHEEET